MITGGAAVVFFAAEATALATGLGATPFAFHGRRVARWLDRECRRSGRHAGRVARALSSKASSAAAGAPPSVQSEARSIRYLAFASSVSTIVTLGSLRGADATKALLIVGVMTAHSAAEGLRRRCVLWRRRSVRAPDRGGDRRSEHSRRTRDQPRAHPPRNARAHRSRLEHLLASPQPPLRTACFRIRRAVPGGPARRTRLRGGSDGVDGRPRAHAHAFHQGPRRAVLVAVLVSFLSDACASAGAGRLTDPHAAHAARLPLAVSNTAIAPIGHSVCRGEDGVVVGLRRRAASPRRGRRARSRPGARSAQMP